MDTDRLKEIRARLDASTKRYKPSPKNVDWEVSRPDEDEVPLNWTDFYMVWICDYAAIPIAQVIKKEDAEFIAHARNDIEYLLSLVNNE